MTTNAPKPWTRPIPARTGPDRSAGGFYRAARGDGESAPFHGIPLLTAQDAAVSAVRAAYRVADAQMERGARIARSLREASAKQGAGGPSESLDAGERLTRKAILAGVEWLETLVAEPGNPVKRVLAAEYKWMGAALGIEPLAASKKESKPAPVSAEASPPGPSRRYAAPPLGPVPKIRHEKGSAFRAVSIVGWQIDCVIPKGKISLRFFSTMSPGVGMIAGELSMVDEVPLMLLQTRDTNPCGRWRSALCNSEDIQFGIVEIEL